MLTQIGSASCPTFAKASRSRPRSLEPIGHVTSPPARYTEAKLVAKLEELGIGRPSTYASIMTTIIDRGYVWKKGSALVPSFTAFAVVRLLEEHFTALIDYQFTANMEDVLDLISIGEADKVAQLEAFWRGGRSVSGDFPGVKPLTEDLGAIDARGIATYADRRHRRGAAGRSLRRLRRARRGACEHPGRPRARRAHRRGCREAAERAVRRSRARRRSRLRPDHRRQVRSLRPVRHRGPARGLAEVRQAAHGVAVHVHDALDRHPRRGAPAAEPAARRRHRPV